LGALRAGPFRRGDAASVPGGGLSTGAPPPSGFFLLAPDPIAPERGRDRERGPPAHPACASPSCTRCAWCAGWYAQAIVCNVLKATSASASAIDASSAAPSRRMFLSAITDFLFAILPATCVSQATQFLLLSSPPLMVTESCFFGNYRDDKKDLFRGEDDISYNGASESPAAWGGAARIDRASARTGRLQLAWRALGAGCQGCEADGGPAGAACSAMPCGCWPLRSCWV
jgi:hypothetical protein